MKHIRSLTTGVVALLALVGLYSIWKTTWSALSVEQRAALALNTGWQELPVRALDCIEYRDDGLPPQRWPQAVAQFDENIARIVPNGLLADDDLWIATGQGLIRLDLRTFQCTIFVQAAQVSLADTNLMLSDGAGGLWVATRFNLLHFSGGQWRLLYQRPDVYYPPIVKDIALRQDGNLCVTLLGSRFFGLSHFCLGEERVYEPLDLTDCQQWQRAASWLARYVTPAGCERVALAESYAFSSISPYGSEVWGVKESLEAQAEGQVARLFYHRGRSVAQIKSPYANIYALAADPLDGGVWMATERGLVYGRVDVGKESSYVFQSFSFNLDTFAPAKQAFRSKIRALAVDTSGQVWLAARYSLLRYDGVLGDWLDVFETSADDISDTDLAIAADPVRGGVWVAGCDKLMYFEGQRQCVWPLPPERDVLHHPFRGSTALLVDSSGRVWVGRIKSGILTTLPPACSSDDEPPALDWRQFTAQDGLADERITALALGPDGRVYAGHHAGVSVFELTGELDNGRWTTLAGSDANARGWVNALAFDQATGELWVGYHLDGFLRSYKDGNWAAYSLPFVRHSIGALLVDDAGNLWIGSTEGLWCWPVGDQLHRQAFAPDLHGPFIHDVVALAQAPGGKDKNAGGRVWAGGLEGVAVLNEPGDE
jgi:ligand-binding sensor domain-containing protein